MSRSVALTLVLMSMVSGIEPSFLASCEAADWSRLPPGIRSLIHVGAKDVPPYPEANDSLMQVRWWPATRVFDGVPYVQEFSASSSDMVKTDLRSFSEIDSGWDYGSHYVTYSKNGKRRSGRGPSYYWRSDSTLAERDYVGTGWAKTWCYTREGDLYQFSFREGNYGDSLIATGTEYFEGDGSLVGFYVASPKLPGNSRNAYWGGTERGWDEWKRLFYEWRRSRHKARRH